MNILVYDVAAAYGGAKIVLDYFYEEYSNETEAEIFFVVSVLNYKEKENLHVLKLPWVKKSWIHRIYCDWVYMRKVIKELSIDEVVSLQNICIPRCKVKQTVYVHNALPFTEHKFSFKEDLHLWVYQNIIGKLILRSVKKANKVIVQTGWMKKIAIEKSHVDGKKISVKKIDTLKRLNMERIRTEELIFFYPTTPVRFKNIQIIIDSCRFLKDRGINNYKVVLTFTGTENKIAESISEQIEEYDLPVLLVGRLDKEKMEEYYRKSVLLFPSYLETVGLPLLEAQGYDADIIAADCLYAHESIGQYKKCSFFNHKNTEDLVDVMVEKLKSHNKK